MQTFGHSFGGSRYRIALCTTRGLSVFSFLYTHPIFSPGTPRLDLRTTQPETQHCLCVMKMTSRHRHVSEARHKYIALTRSSALAPGSFSPNNSTPILETVTMTPGPVFDGSAVASYVSKPLREDDTKPNSTSLPVPPSVQREQSDLPEVSSLQMIISDPVTACHGCPVQQAVATDGKAEPGVAGDGCVEDSASPPAGDDGNSREAADRSAPTPRYRPAYELTDAAHERLGRSTHTLNA